ILKKHLSSSCSCKIRPHIVMTNVCVFSILKDDKGNYDQDKILQCPFDKNHKMRASRFPYHLIKCRKNHPKLASELKPCPFNARHLVPGHEMTHHIETCQNRISVESEECEISFGSLLLSQVPNNAWVKPNMTEDWDKGRRSNTLSLLHLGTGCIKQTDMLNTERWRQILLTSYKAR
uniref:Zgc:56699 n=1 Tax=Echeneis naucrates TaxID=173247 RepID=A0A665SXP4_ECHNA